MKGSDKKVGSQTEFSKELESLRNEKLFRKFTCVEATARTRVVIEGQRYVNFASNDYLNLSSHPEIVKAASSALKKYGFGTGASRLLSGTRSPHVKLEQRIAQFKKTQSALLFNSGYAANTGIIPALAGADAVIFSDKLNHASIVDGTRLSKADVRIFRHRDVNHLESLLKKWTKSKPVKRGLVITDTVFSMDGDVAPLKDIAWLCDTYDALLMIDDAHGTGVLGQTGRGGLEHFGMKAENIIQMGTLSKAAGSYGAFVAGKRDLIELLINRSRSLLYSTSLPPAVCEAGIRAIDIIDSKSMNLRKKLWKNRKRLFDGLHELGYNTFHSETPIIPVSAGSVKEALRIGNHLYRNDIFAPAIRPPTVPDGKCRIRFTVTAGHTENDIDLALNVLRRFQ